MFDPSSIPPALRSSCPSVAARIEDAALTASQPRQQTFYDGWLLRHSPGKARRARSVNTLAAGALPLTEKLAHCEEFYLRNDLPCIYRITPLSAPENLDAALAARGYTAGGDTRVMVLDLAAVVRVSAPAVGLQSVDAADFGEALGKLHQLGPDKAAAERDRFARSAVPGLYFVVREESLPIACGSIAIDGTLAGVFGMVTAAAHRARGLASAIVIALLGAARERGVATAYLQVEADNAPARRVYQKFGFADCYAYWYRTAPGAEENSR